jgi:hypothetical protein
MTLTPKLLVACYPDLRFEGLPSILDLYASISHSGYPDGGWNAQLWIPSALSLSLYGDLLKTSVFELPALRCMIGRYGAGIGAHMFDIWESLEHGREPDLHLIAVADRRYALLPAYEQYYDMLNCVMVDHLPPTREGVTYNLTNITARARTLMERFTDEQATEPAGDPTAEPRHDGDDSAGPDR